MSIKAVILITDEKGHFFEGTAELLPKEGRAKRKGTLVTKKAQIKEARSKIIIRLRQFISEGFFNKSTRRTINEIREKLRAKGISLKNTQLQPYLTRMVKNDELERDQVIRDNRKVFLYSKI